MSITEFLEEDENRLEQLIEQYPRSIPTKALADFLDLDVVSVRTIIEGGQIGLHWKKAGKLNSAYCVPTATFVRWYLRK